MNSIDDKEKSAPTDKPDGYGAVTIEGTGDTKRIVFPEFSGARIDEGIIIPGPTVKKEEDAA